MFQCPKCGAGTSKIRLVGANPVKMLIRKVFLTCTDCGRSFTMRGEGMKFNENVMRVGNNSKLGDNNGI